MSILKKVNIFYLFLLFIISYSCKSCENKKIDRLNVICLIDYSGSLPENVLKSYATIISEKIYGNLHNYDQITIMPIDEGAKTDATKIFFENFAIHKKFSKQSDGLAHRQDSIKKRMADYTKLKIDSIFNLIIAQKTLRKKFTNETDIISAIEQASLLIERPTDVSKFNSINSIIIFSDMLHEASNFNLRTIRPNGLKTFDDIIDNLAKANHIPNLKNCFTFVNGRTGANNKIVDDTQYFWQQYFSKANANLKAYDFDCNNAIAEFIKQRQ